MTCVEELLIWFKKELVDICSFTIYTEMKEGAGIDSLIYFKNIIIERWEAPQMHESLDLPKPITPIPTLGSQLDHQPR